MSGYFTGDEYVNELILIEDALGQLEREVNARRRTIEDAISDYSFPSYKLSQVHSIRSSLSDLKIKVREAMR